MKYFKLLITIFLSFLLLQSCGTDDSSGTNSIDKLTQVKKRTKLVALTGFNAYSYFIYKGEPMGFEYDLVKKLAGHFNVELELKVVNDINNMFTKLQSGEGDLITFNLTITKERLKKVDFTHPINTIKQVLIQRKPDNWEKMKLHEIEKQLIRDPADLIGKTVIVRSSSSYVRRLINLSDEIGGDIIIVEAELELTTEDLIAQVASGEIDYTISDDNIANLNAAYYRNIDTKTSISLSQRIGWAVQKDSKEFLTEINKWLDSLKKTIDFTLIYKKYFTNRYAFKKRLSSDYFSNTGGGISKYDDLIRKYSKTIGWDWRLGASVIYQESQFNPDAKSWAGAVGLMQLMPNTGKQFGVINFNNPEQNINAGFKYFAYLDRLWKDLIPDSTERIKFVLASYNIGPGHILDARSLADKYGGNPDIWFDGVDYYLRMKSKPKYYNDEVVKRGYARGNETIKYVKEILDRYEQYEQLIN
ncbi:MAG: transporter substrate-binding domain-containing protein [Ignavibacteria bacterium]|nr:transporter substrate-binding domain-containing protein [Ignavibacteria bacterium]